ncbi:MAG: AmmeMemoRadiSam system protein B [Candidatus Cloacimonetes bacterium]|nr:AmmeMemoRadiSam system protein B [Candidatus Cloacimonadota bacterium]
MKTVRPSAVSGMFYPKDKEELQSQVENFIAQAKTESFSPIQAVIAPHAGYFYSGTCAGYAYKALSQKQFKRVLILAPAHRVGGFTCSVGDYRAYSTPLGEIAVDEEVTAEFLTHDGFDFHPQAHASEHALEVQLPFLQILNPSVTIVPILYGSQNLETAHYIAQTIHTILGSSLDETAIVISSDLSHFHSAVQAESMDKHLINHVTKMDSDALWGDIRHGNIEACGVGGIIAALILAEITGYSHSTELMYTHSGKVTGDNSQVVGYFSAVIHQ